MLLTLTVAWRLFAASVLPAGGDPFPYFKPDPVVYTCEEPHWKATECARSDVRCQAEHDGRVQDLAIMTGNARLCWSAVNPAACVDVVKMVLGDL